MTSEGWLKALELNGSLHDAPTRSRAQALVRELRRMVGARGADYDQLADEREIGTAIGLPDVARWSDSTVRTTEAAWAALELE